MPNILPTTTNGALYVTLSGYTYTLAKAITSCKFCNVAPFYVCIFDGSVKDTEYFILLRDSPVLR